MSTFTWVWRRVGPVIRSRRLKRSRRPNVASRKHYKEHKETARSLIHSKIAEFNLHYNFKFNKVAIRNQRSRWGSCSKKGNLNFNYRLALIPEALVDYVIVHELCHLGEFNHSRNFWNLVAQKIPDHVQRRKQLHKIRF